MSEQVPASTKIRRAKVGNIDADRLERRRGWLFDLIRNRGRTLDQRIDFVQRVLELSAIELELVRRGLLVRADAHCSLVDRNGNPLPVVDMATDSW